MNEEYYEVIKNLQTVFQSFNKTINPQILEAGRTLSLVSERIKEITEPFSKINTTEYMKPVFDQFKRFAEEVQKAKESPDSVFNYYRYSKKMDDFHWTWPYGISSAEMLNAIENIQSEEEFDAWLIEYFDNQKIDQLFIDVIAGAPDDYLEAIKQVRIAIDTGIYILANNTLVSILDGLLSRYMSKKKIVHRRDILEPIIDFYDQYSLEKIPFIFELGMLNENINFIFEDVDFSQVEINSHKQVRRHTSMHGMRYSNERIDAVFLVNAIYWLIAFDDKLKPFENSIKEKDGKFKIKQDLLGDITKKINDVLDEG